MAAFAVVIRGNDGETPPSREEQWTPTGPSSARLHTQTVYPSIRLSASWTVAGGKVKVSCSEARVER